MRDIPRLYASACSNSCQLVPTSSHHHIDSLSSLQRAQGMLSEVEQIELARMQMMILASDELIPGVEELVNQLNSTTTLAETMEALDINETLSDINAIILATTNETALANLSAMPGQDMQLRLNATTIAERIENCLVLQNGTLTCLQRSTVLR